MFRQKTNINFFRRLRSAAATCALTLAGCSEKGSEAPDNTADNPGRTDAPPVFMDAPTATAALRSVLAGYSIKFDPVKLAEECKVDETGASVDDIEDLANAHGLVAEQRLFPTSDLCTGDGVQLPAIIITVREGANREFVNVWRRRGNRVQIMDPWVGVSWVECSELQRRAYIHEMEVSGTTHRGLVGVVIFGRADSGN